LSEIFRPEETAAVAALASLYDARRTSSPPPLS
jgi:hypothetical protein